MLPLTRVNISDVAELYGYHLKQVNGQRIFGPPKDWTGPPPPKGCEVFVGRLPRQVYEDVMFPLFSKVGKVYAMRLMMDFSGSNRGYGFVTYTTRRDANAATRQLGHYPIIPGHHIGVKKSVDNCRLHISGISVIKSKYEVLVELRKYVEGIDDIIFYRNSFDRILNRGFVIVRFHSHADAADARRALVPGHVQMWGGDIVVNWAEPEPDIDDDQYDEVNVLSLKYLYMYTTEDTIRNVIEDAIGTRVASVNKTNDYCFVHFYESKHAKLALRLLQNTEIDGVNVAITLEPRFVKHQQNASVFSHVHPQSGLHLQPFPTNECAASSPDEAIGLTGSFGSSDDSLLHKYPNPSIDSVNYLHSRRLILRRTESCESPPFKHDCQNLSQIQHHASTPLPIKRHDSESYGSLIGSPVDVRQHQNSFLSNSNDLIASTPSYHRTSESNVHSSPDQGIFLSEYSATPIRRSSGRVGCRCVIPPDSGESRSHHTPPAPTRRLSFDQFVQQLDNMALSPVRKTTLHPQKYFME